MYGFPNQQDLSSIIGKNLIMVCCNANQIYLHFDSQISISIGTNQFQIKSIDEITEIKIPINNVAVFELLEQKAVNISVNNNNSILEITFENNRKIILTDDKNYESHLIKIGNKEIVV